MVEVDKYSCGIVKDRNRLYWADFKRMPTSYPPPDEQVQIANVIDQSMTALDDRMQRIHCQIALLQEYRTRLIAHVVTGKLEVREAASLLEKADEQDRLDKGAPLVDGVVDNLYDTTDSTEELAMENEVTV